MEVHKAMYIEAHLCSVIQPDRFVQYCHSNPGHQTQIQNNAEVGGRGCWVRTGTWVMKPPPALTQHPPTKKKV